MLTIIILRNCSTDNILLNRLQSYHVSRVMRKSVFCIGENQAADQFAQLISAIAFAA